MQSKNRLWFLAGALCMIAVGTCAYFISRHFRKDASQQATTASIVASQFDCGLRRINMQGYKFVKPILMMEKDCESADLFPLKNELQELIARYQTDATINNAAICVFDMNRSEWTGVNENLGFIPGSLIKVPLAICVMKMVEQKKMKLTDELEASSLVPVHQTYNSNTIEVGKKYSIQELLKYSLAYSDNSATQILNNFVDLTILKKVFTDLGMAEPNVRDINYTISAKDYSKFIRILYNGTYIGRGNSEIILSLMNESSFKDGILASIDKNKAVVSSKFGESKKGNEHQLHETAVVYVNNSAYIVTIMTAGRSVDKLPAVIRNLSKLVYDNMVQGNTTIVAGL